MGIEQNGTEDILITSKYPSWYSFLQIQFHTTPCTTSKRNVHKDTTFLRLLKFFKACPNSQKQNFRTQNWLAVGITKTSPTQTPNWKVNLWMIIKWSKAIKRKLILNCNKNIIKSIVVIKKHFAHNPNDNAACEAPPTTRYLKHNPMLQNKCNLYVKKNC